jgi:ABC-2 type transport system permease protein
VLVAQARDDGAAPPLSSAAGWVLALSPFSHLAPVPAVPADVAAPLVMLAVATAFALAGTLAFAQRDKHVA